MKNKKNCYFLFVILLITFSSKAQNDTSNYPIPDFVNSFYAVVGSQPVALEKQEASVKAKIKAGTFFVPLAGGTKSYAMIKGAKSTTRFQQGDITFIYEPSEMADPSQTVKITKLESNPRKDQRDIQVGSSSAFRAKANQFQSVPFTFKKYHDKYIVLTIHDIEPGEYGVLLTGSDNSAISNVQYQLFGVD